MKKIYYFTLLFLFFQGNVFSQYDNRLVINNLVVFANDGELFTLILNGVKQNQTPDTRVRVTDLNLKVYKVNLLFENKKLKSHTTTLTFFSTNRECVFALNGHGKKHTMDYLTDTPINEIPEEKSEPKADVPVVKSTTITATNTPPVTTTAPLATPTPSPSKDNMSIKTGKGDLDLGSGGVKINTHGVNLGVNPKTKTAESSVTVLGTTVALNKSLKTGCSSPMSGLDFEESKKGIVSQPTDSTKMLAAVKVINANCMLTAQVKEITTLFETDLNKLHFAKKAYAHTSDLSKFGQLEDTFTSAQGKKDMHDFIKSQK